MLRNASVINGYAIAASDGHLGTVSDFLFDDVSWLIRWLVVDIGTWLSGRKVILPAFALGHLDPARREFFVRLTMQEVKDSPDIDTKRPVSRQMEASIYDHYGWSPYWGAGLYMGGYGYGDGGSLMAPLSARGSMRRDEDITAVHRGGDDQHLRSFEAITGYHIHTSDGDIGHVEDFLVEEADWAIHYLVVDTKNWLPGKRVLVSPRSVTEIDWTDNLVKINVSRRSVKDSPAYDASKTVDRTYEKQFHKYYDEVRPGNLP
jgi:sporulation protein YlmC with PRC-barrel domain